MNKLEIEKEVVSQIIAMYPSSWGYISDSMKAGYANQIFMGLNESDLNNNEYIERGLMNARTFGDSELPSVPVFISWCTSPLDTSIFNIKANNNGES